MIELRNLSAGYGGEPVLKDVSLTLPEGQVSVLLGENGCGKSTLLKTLTGLLSPQGGEILLDGIPLSALSPGERARKISYLPQGRFVPEITVGRMVLHGRFPHLSYPRRYGRKDYEAAEEAMARMGLTGLEDRLLSGGMRQKVYLAMALAQQTPVILMDEPTTYLDVARQLDLAELVRGLAEQGKTVLAVLHDLPMALKLAHRAAVMEDGRVAAAGTPDELLASGIIEEVFGVTVGQLETGRGRQLFYEY